jgi:predicted ATPase
MFTRIHAHNYRCLQAVDQSLGSFRALVGPNASGKTTFLDVISLLSDLMTNRGDVVAAVQRRSLDFSQLLWKGNGHSFELALEAQIPEQVHQRMSSEWQIYSHVRYEAQIGIEDNQIGLNHEYLWLMTPDDLQEPQQRTLFPSETVMRQKVISKSGKGRKAAITKKPGGNDNYYPTGRKSYKPSMKLGRQQAALANVPADRESFPVSTWFRDELEKGVELFVLNSQIIRQPSPPGLGKRFQPTGANLPWVIDELRGNPRRFEAWLSHVRTALEDIRDITTIERPEDRHRYLVIEYSSGACVPSWLVSDGTLRLLALTIPAYLDDLSGTFLIEEPENGIHPRAIETVLQSLSSMYGSQVILATHSPVALNMLKPADVLCFAKNDSGASDIESGDRHPALREWKEGDPDFGTLFAAGILS